MNSRRSRRVMIEVPENADSNTQHVLASLAVGLFQSFLLLRDAAMCEATTQPPEPPSSRYVPAAIIMLHAAFDAFLNARLGVTPKLLEQPNPEMEEMLKALMGLSLSSKSKKASKLIEKYELKRPFSPAIIDNVELLCDVRDVLFHTEPTFVAAHEFPAPIEKVCRRARVEFQRNRSWKQHVERTQVLEWAYNTVIAYFKEWELTTGCLNDLENSMDGKQVEYKNMDTGNMSYGYSMEDLWRGVRKRLYPMLADLK